MAIFFDLDGTLLDVKARYLTLAADLMRSLGLDSQLPDDYWAWKRSGLSQPQLLERCGVVDGAEEFITRYVEAVEERRYLAMDRLWSGMDECLALLAEETPLFIVTLRRRRENLECQLDELGIARHFEAVLCVPGGVSAMKTKARLIDAAGHDASTDLMIGDSMGDIRGAQSLDLATCAVTYGVHDEDHLAPLAARYTVRAPGEVLATLRAHLARATQE
jgi:phosphoglycolate phosphatase-like HAD superfamily hydrolase